MENKELLEYITSWLAYYNHRQMFDGIVPMNTARLMVESSIDDELRKQGKDLAEHAIPIIQSAERERIFKQLEDYFPDAILRIKAVLTKEEYLALKGGK